MRKHPKIPVRILSSDAALPYAKPHLSKAYLRGRNPKLDLHGPGWFVQNDIRLHRGITVDHIDLANREVVTGAGTRYPYWHLVLASGATPVPLPVPAANLRWPCDRSPTPSSCGWRPRTPTRPS